MSVWTDGYRAAIEDIRTLFGTRELMTPPIATLFDDLQQDALVIAHEQDSKLQRRKLRAASEALPLLDGGLK